MQDKDRKILISFVLLLVVGVFIFFTTRTLSFLANDTKVEESSELIYYIDVKYDGIDEYSNFSDYPIKVYSDVINVYDKLPEGLEFVRFLKPSNNRFEAKSDTNSYCSGTVVGQYNGLSYNSETRTVSFDVQHLQAGCYIRVGVVTKTGYVSNGERVDYYNTAYATENGNSATSATVHAYIGDETKPLYQVNYEFTGDVPEGVQAPTSKSYSNSSIVGLEASINLPGYTFSGWTTTDVTVSDNKFTMPANTVTFKGSFTENPSYTVSFSISGDKPSSFIVPSSKTYRVGEIVTLYDSSFSPYYEDYEFNGWTTADDIGFYNTYFIMPDHDIEFVGSFSREKYELCFEFDDSVHAPVDKPPCESHYYGEEVTLPEITAPEGFKFVGWSEDSPFTMPHDYTEIIGSFMHYNGSFRPTLNKEITNAKPSYKSGDNVDFDITVTNNQEYPIKEVMIRETSPCYFLENDGKYILKSETFALIDVMEANTSVTLKARCVAGNDPVATYVNTARLVGGLADNYYYLDLDTPITATASYEVGNIVLNVINKSVSGNDLSTQTVFELYKDINLTEKIGEGFKYEALSAGTYYLVQKRAATGYQIINNPLIVTISSNGVVSIPNYQVSGSDGNYSVTIINEEIDLLPSSGGPGTIYYVLIGLLIVIIGSGFYYVDKRKSAR